MIDGSDPRVVSAFLDTTVPCDRVLADRGRHTSVEERLRGYGAIAASRFVQLEFSLGVYGHLAKFQAKAEAGASVAELHSEAIRYATMPPPRWQRRVGAVVLEVINQFIAELEDHSASGSISIAQLRAFLRQYVRRAWRRAFRDIEAILDPSGALDDLPQPEWDSASGSMRNVASKRYIETKAPQLAAFIRNQGVQFQAIVDAIDLDGRDSETSRRITALNKILSGEAETTAGDIRNVGDALVAVECPHSHVLLNNNTKHFDPITEAIGKVSEPLYTSSKG